MIYQFSQTSAAIILDKLNSFVSDECLNQNDYVIFLKKLCHAAIKVYGQEREIDDFFKSQIALSFSNASFFLRSNFNESLASNVCDEIVFPARDEAINKVIKAIGFETNDSDFSEEALNSYFQNNISAIFEKEFGKGLKVVHTESFLNIPNMALPDKKSTLNDHIVSCMPVIQEKRGIVNNITIREFLVYYSIKVFDELQNHFTYLPYTLMTQLYDQMEEVCAEIFDLPFEHISPEKEIFDTYTTDRIVTTKNKYFDWLLS